MSKLNILTLSWQGEEKLKKLAPTLLASLKDINYDWFIKDNGSTDASVEYLRSLGSNINIVSYKNNLQNFAEGVNLLFATAAPADNDLVLLLNNDVSFNDTSSIRNMISILQKNSSDVGIVGARLLYTGTNKIQHAGVVFNSNHKMPVHFRAKEATDKNAERNREFQACTAAVLLTKAEYYKNAYTANKSGQLGMDENFKWSFDDVDLCLSIKYNMGKKIVYCGKTNISHEESATLKKMPQNKLFMGHNRALLISKWQNRYQLDQDFYIKDPKYKVYDK